MVDNVSFLWFLFLRIIGALPAQAEDLPVSSDSMSRDDNEDIQIMITMPIVEVAGPANAPKYTAHEQ